MGGEIKRKLWLALDPSLGARPSPNDSLSAAVLDGGISEGRRPCHRCGSFSRLAGSSQRLLMADSLERRRKRDSRFGNQVRIGNDQGVGIDEQALTQELRSWEPGGRLNVCLLRQ